MTNLTLTSGLQLLRQKAYKELHSKCIAAINCNVHDPLPYSLLGILTSDHGNYGKSLELHEKAVEYGPDVAEYHAYHAKLLSTMGRQNAAKQSADLALKCGTDDPELSDILGVVYSRAGYHETAIPLFEKATRLKPNIANFHFNLAASAQFIGDFETARKSYETTLNLDPTFYRAWSSLVALGKQTVDANDLEILTGLFETLENDADGQVQIGHAIAKTLEDLGRHVESLKWLRRGKKAKRDQLRYDRTIGERLFAAAKRTSTPVARPAEHASEASPIFVVGLPRTGTTLVDRILSSHSDVISAGELNVFAELVKQSTKTPSNLVMEAETLLKTENLDLSAIGQDYIAKTADRAQGAIHMLDKMPLNFFYAGLIHRALPEARIIALRRGAMDSCLSNYRQLFSTQYSYYNYTFDLQDTAWFYRQFDSLMAHWRVTLPPQSFMEVRYEDIVFDQENQTRRLLDFCSLPWQDACLNFHKNAAPVSTASSVQVRQPLYSGSIGRWKKYGDDLDDLRAALGDLAD